MSQLFNKSNLYSLIFRGWLTFLLFISYIVTAQVTFKDITSESGIQHQFRVYEGMFGGGACVFDFNNDGWEDLFITGGMNNDALYQNNGDGTFKNIFMQAGLESTMHYVTQGVSSADLNKDGWADLFITTITTRDSLKTIPRAENLVFINNGNSTFRNATKEYEIDLLMSFSTGVSFGDFNEDGYPDAYVGNYFLDYQGQLNSINDATIVNSNTTSKGYLLLNQGGKYFTNVYEDYDLKHKGFGFGAVFTDFDNDDDQDLFVNHDFGYKAMPDVLLENLNPSRSFKDVSKMFKMDLKMNAMGTAVGDYNNDGLLDYYVTNIRFNHFMVNQGEVFIDKAKELGMGYVSISWGANFADFDNDTDLDLFVSNGDLNPNDVPMADYYFENKGETFTEKARAAGLDDYGIGRGSVVFDMDNDGDLDLLVVNQKPVLNYPVNSETHLYRNDSSTGNWLKVALKGVNSDMHGLGSRIEVVIGKIRMIREIDGGSSHLSQNSTIAHFGLGEASVVDSVVVTWVGGKKQISTNQKANTLLIVNEIPDEKTYVQFIIGAVVVLAIILILFFYKTATRKIVNTVTSSKS
jgi:hypothetical protein